MVMLHESDIETKEVLTWRGMHLFHNPRSTCSQKVRIFLRLKGIEWTSHVVDLLKKEQHSDFYMGINPRGLVPTLVHDGRVVIESNDILSYLESEFPDPPLIPHASRETVQSLLKFEDDLHLDIRALTMRFVFPTFLVRRSEKDIVEYESTGSGMVNGVSDPNRRREAKFWRDMNTHGGITDARARLAFDRFRNALDAFEATLAHDGFLAGDALSALDIAWYIYARRLLSAGYPLARLHPNFAAWFERVHADPKLRGEVPEGGVPDLITKALHAAQRFRGTTLQAVVA